MKKAVLFLGIGLGLLSCSEKENLPTEEVAKIEVAELIKTESEDKVELVEFNKTDGLKKTINGVDYYAVEFDGKISYKKDGYSFLGIGYGFSDNKGVLTVKDEVSFVEKNYLKEVKIGQKQGVKGAIGFVKTENGWKKLRVQFSPYND